MKTKKIFNCTNCGAGYPKWNGKCSSCGEWNTLVEEVLEKPTKNEQKLKSWGSERTSSKPTLLKDVKFSIQEKITTPDQELDRVLGGGIVKGSLILIGGQPGIGKSTLLLQMAINMDAQILYVSGEESDVQIKMRAERLGSKNENCYLLSETNVSKILQEAKNLNPDLIIIDSIQTLSSPYIESTPGSVSQVRECTNDLQRFAKETNIPVFIIGHINKDGAIAGPKLLEHIVDTVLQFEGDRNYSYRILRTIKNRFGSTDELGIYEMQGKGLREVSNPSELLLSQSDNQLSGSTVAATMEGMRPMLIESQALVSTAVYGTPQRSVTGYDLRRLNMLLAVLEKRAGLLFGQQDVFLNLAGGIKVADPAIDLAITAAMISSLQNIAVSNKIAFAGEVGLTGEIRAVNRIEQRIQEADRLGFEAIYLSKFNMKGLDQSKYHLELNPISKIDDLLAKVFS